MVRLSPRTQIGELILIVPLTRNTHVRAPVFSAQSRKLPGPESSRLVTSITRPALPPFAHLPNPSAVGNARGPSAQAAEGEAVGEVGAGVYSGVANGLGVVDCEGGVGEPVGHAPRQYRVGVTTYCAKIFLFSPLRELLIVMIMANTNSTLTTRDKRAG
jgi:hypothetical protein